MKYGVTKYINENGEESPISEHPNYSKIAMNKKDELERARTIAQRGYIDMCNDQAEWPEIAATLLDELERLEEDKPVFTPAEEYEQNMKNRWGNGLD